MKNTKLGLLILLQLCLMVSVASCSDTKKKKVRDDDDEKSEKVEKNEIDQAQVDAEIDRIKSILSEEGYYWNTEDDWYVNDVNGKKDSYKLLRSHNLIFDNDGEVDYVDLFMRTYSDEVIAEAERYGNWDVIYDASTDSYRLYYNYYTDEIETINYEMSKAEFSMFDTDLRLFFKGYYDQEEQEPSDYSESESEGIGVSGTKILECSSNVLILEYSDGRIERYEKQKIDEKEEDAYDYDYDYDYDDVY